MRPIETRGIEHIGVQAHDTESLTRWYKTVFGAREVSRSDDDPAIIFLKIGDGALMEFVPAPDGSDVKGTTHICFDVSSINQALNELGAHAIPLAKPPFTAYDGSRTAFFSDPEGNLLQLVERAAWSDIRANT